MSDFKAKIHNIRFPLALHPKPRWGAYSAPADPWLYLMGPTSKGRAGEEGREGKRRERGGEGKRRGGEGPGSPNILG